MVAFQMLTNAHSTLPSVTTANVSITPGVSDVNVTWALQPRMMSMFALVNFLLPLQDTLCNFINTNHAFTRSRELA